MINETSNEKDSSTNSIILNKDELSESVFDWNKFWQKAPTEKANPLKKGEYNSTIKHNQFSLSQGLVQDLVEINQQNDDTAKILLVNLRKEMAKILLSESGLSGQENNDKDNVLANLITQNPKICDRVIYLEKLYLAGLAKRLKKQNDALRTSQSSELKNKEGLEFNLRVDDIPAAQAMKKSQSEPVKLEEIFLDLDAPTLLKINLAYYLDIWSRHWYEDLDYARYFYGENAYLQDSLLPIDQEQLVIPDVYLAPESTQDLMQARQTHDFHLNHIPDLYLPLSARIKGYSLTFEINNEPIGSFPGERIAVNP